MQVRLEPSWQNLLRSELDQPYFADLASFVRSEYHTHTVYPPGRLIFNALDSLPVSQVKVVILGQDPYHGSGQAHGLSFSVPDGVKPPPSLTNIYKELSSDLGITPPKSGNLTRWVEQGVLLLNSTLTVRAHQAGSHQKKGWERFTDAIIHTLASERSHLVFILWGRYAQAKGSFIDTDRHLVLRAPHPSPLSAHAGFFGSRPFSQTNHYLTRHNIEPILW
jgi:uracil-DNA glycosylase